MERHRGGGGEDRYGNHPDAHEYSRHYRGGPPSSRSSFSSETYHHHRRSPMSSINNDNSSSYRGGGGGVGPRDHLRPFDSPPPRYPSPYGSGRGGFRPMGISGGGETGDFSTNHPVPTLAGQKRGYPFSDGRESPPGELN